jgi:hypothetical protein
VIRIETAVMHGTRRRAGADGDGAIVEQAWASSLQRDDAPNVTPIARGTA